MSLILTEKYRSFLATQFQDSLVSDRTAAYVFLGHPTPWTDTANAVVSDSHPSVPADSPQNTDFACWRDMLGAKRVTSTAIVVARQDWVTGTIYDQYDDQDSDLASKTYFVLDTTDSPVKVYKCVWNAKRVPSTAAPSTVGTALVPTQTSDGYVWQYMYTIDSGNAASYLTATWMPVLANSAVQANALTNTGKLPTNVPLVVVDGGVGYNALLPVTVTLVGDGSGATVASGVSITGGSVTQVVLATGGADYTEVSSINVYQAGASTPANARAIIPPFPNHGYDPVKELGAAALMLSIVFDEDESGKLTVYNDYRRYGLLINPDEFDGNVALGSFYRQTTDITISGNNGVLLPDDTITNISKASSPTATVVDVIEVSSNYVVRVTGVDPEGEAAPFESGDTIKNLTSGVEATVSVVSNPELQPYSGAILCVNHRTPVARSNTQVEDITIVFPFK